MNHGDDQKLMILWQLMRHLDKNQREKMRDMMAARGVVKRASSHLAGALAPLKTKASTRAKMHAVEVVLHGATCLVHCCERFLISMEHKLVFNCMML